ncbi:uncharacterized protein LOC110823209 [Carica papaya]|uniref:uncharacterized protein LOC110823209 n=1 Tax=Carica papaya TaxID=3649 RepID=UPI000B8D10F2|nr:uncharacterized protein LOC110823209 [Carica papaya]
MENVRKEKCECCGIWEECTSGYIGWVQERFGGVWVCGLCEEAIKDEQARLGGGVGVEVALGVHAAFRAATRADPALCLTHSLLQLLRKIMSSSSPSSSPPPPASSSSSSSSSTSSS